MYVPIWIHEYVCTYICVCFIFISFPYWTAQSPQPYSFQTHRWPTWCHSGKCSETKLGLLTSHILTLVCLPGPTLSQNLLLLLQVGSSPLYRWGNWSSYSSPVTHCNQLVTSPNALCSDLGHDFKAKAPQVVEQCHCCSSGDHGTCIGPPLHGEGECPLSSTSFQACQCLQSLPLTLLVYLTRH